MADSGIDPGAGTPSQRLAVLGEIEWLEEMLLAHRGLFDRDEAVALLDASLDEALMRRRRWLAAQAAG